MRWTDLPPDREPADAGASRQSRGEWEDLRQRLERLPAGHPSRPEAGEGEGGDAPVDEGGEDDAVAERGSSEAGGHAGRDGGGRRASRDGGRAAAGRREPYRPWFTAGESPEPWFAAGAGE